MQTWQKQKSDLTSCQVVQRPMIQSRLVPLGGASSLYERPLPLDQNRYRARTHRTSLHLLHIGSKTSGESSCASSTLTDSKLPFHIEQRRTNVTRGSNHSDIATHVSASANRLKLFPRASGRHRSTQASLFQSYISVPDMWRYHGPVVPCCRAVPSSISRLASSSYFSTEGVVSFTASKISPSNSVKAPALPGYVKKLSLNPNIFLLITDGPILSSLTGKVHVPIAILLSTG